VSAVSRNIQIAFDDEGMLDDVGNGIPIESIFVPDAPTTLCELLLPRLDGIPISVFEDCEFEPEDHQIVELLLGCSLFHLNTSH
jgi:hypothetical protein